MSGIVSLELVFDAALEASVRAEWEALEEAGLPSLARHTAPSNRPHITLVVRSELAPIDATGLAARLPLPLTLGAPLLFGTGPRRVLARAVIPSEPLLALHRDLRALAGPGDDVPHTAEGEWMPHVTLARRIRLEDLPRALPLLGDELAGTATVLRRWDAASATITPLAGAADPGDESA